MIEYEPPTFFDIRDVTTTAQRRPNNWSVRMTHKPSGLFVLRSGVGSYEHQIDVRREAMNELKEQVDNYYKEEYVKPNA